MDEDLRDLERAAARGEPDARRALLVARRRAGRLDDERLAYAAALGDPDARALLGESAPARLGLVAWFEAVRHEPWGPSAYLAGAIAAARAVLPLFEARHPEDLGPRRCIEAAERVLERHEDAVREQARTLAAAQRRVWLDRSRRAPPHGRLPDHVLAAQVAHKVADAAARGLADVPVLYVVCFHSISEATKVARRRAVQNAIPPALCRWLLE